MLRAQPRHWDPISGASGFGMQSLTLRGSQT